MCVIMWLCINFNLASDGKLQVDKDCYEINSTTVLSLLLLMLEVIVTMKLLKSHSRIFVCPNFFMQRVSYQQLEQFIS